MERKEVIAAIGGCELEAETSSEKMVLYLFNFLKLNNIVKETNCQKHPKLKPSLTQTQTTERKRG